ncbi:MAG: hypothetical protein HKP37_08215 [Boseongicola sp.]|nr:hypothetical protein [Boseongicola sp.]
MKRIHPIILCGGSGTRLWPVSRTNCPKQFQSTGGEASVSFFQETVQRQTGESFFPPTIVTNDCHLNLVQQQLSDINSSGAIVCEPISRGTGPAVLAAAYRLCQGESDALMLVTPADHLIQGKMSPISKRLMDTARSGRIIVFGITPRSPDSGFGYVVPGPPVPGNQALHLCDRFIEKPKASKAKRLIKDYGALWASGIALFSARTLIEEYERFDRNTAIAVKRSVEYASVFSDAIHLDRESFKAAKAAATENAVFEKSDRIVSKKLSVKWNDVGSWAAMFEVSDLDSSGNSFTGDVVSVGSSNTLVRSESRLVSVVGLEDIVIVDTPDALLVTNRESSQLVKDAVEIMKRKGRLETEREFKSTSKDRPSETSLRQANLKISDSLQLGTRHLPIGDTLAMEAGYGRQFIVVKGVLEAQGPTWRKVVSEGGRIYSDPNGLVTITNCDNCDGELLSVSYNANDTSPKSTSVAMNV